MARVVVLGGGVSGHTAATFLKDWLGSNHEVVVVTPNSKWNWIPSNIWVGVGKMKKDDVVFDLGPVYKKAGIDYRQAKALSIHPEGSKESESPYVTIEYTGQDKEGEKEEITYDYLINATGPKLNFGATEGLGPHGGHTVSVCTADHAIHANEELQKCIAKMKAGEKQTLVIGTGHGMCTCQGAAFEYIFNIDYELRAAGVRDKAELIWLTNESFLGDFGMGGMHIRRGGYIASSKVFAESLFAEHDMEWILGTHVTKVEEGKIHYETLDGDTDVQEFDFSMLIPPFGGVGLKAYDKEGGDITDKVFAPNGFMKVDADYTPKPYEEWKASDWPKTLQNPDYKNMFAVGIAFAPPHLMSKPMKNPNGTPINPTPPRTGMPSAMMGKAVAQTLKDMILSGAKEPTHTASMAEMGAACVASAGSSMLNGKAVSMTVYPVVPDYEKYPGVGRDLDYTTGEIGLAGHWIKYFLHYAFMWKAQLKPGWKIIPE
ncbi:NAD(P)/FAD-dependent oxidoreductase [Hydrogenimonas cancrithermarum]|uniref:Sulfide:quinone reductase n=1 Tax=Hydrogenimonas cancrithermarum TaxID=2993563 RepID=A0ABM8FKC6_9BACT|nr:FAD-dependent oxidoreductase [Hydrogenimonas cancrithermarum]BDY11821.1 sulfide:quinone reductase [Hydrogenimonas cancrithermarum]